MKCPGGVQVQLPLLALSVAVCTFCMLPYFYAYTNVNQIQTILVNFTNSSLSAHYSARLSESNLLLVWGLIVALNPISSIASAWFAYPVKARLGCKRALFVVCCGLNVISALLQCIAKYADSIELFALGIVFSGTGAIWTMNVFGPIYLTECSPPGLRGFTSIIGSVGGYAGIFLAFVIGLPNALGNEELWGIYCLLPAALSITGMVLSHWMPDSPKDLHMTLNDPVKARRNVSFLYGEEHHDIDAVIRGFDEEHRQTRADFRLSHLISQSHLRKALVISLIINVLGASTGPMVLFLFSNPVFLNLGLSDAQAGSLNVALITPLLVLTPISMLIVERLGRRTMVLGFGVAMVGALAFYTVCGMLAVRVFPQAVWLRYLAAMGILLDVWLMPMGPPIFAFYLPSELFPQHARTAGSAMAAVMLNICLTVTLLVFPLLLDAIGPLAVVVAFIVPSLVALGVLAKMMPETAGRSINEIVRELIGETGEQPPTLHNYGAVEQKNGMTTTL